MSLLGLVVPVALVAAVVAWAVGIYNRLVGLKNRALAAWSDIDVQLKRRHDLVGNLVETVKGYASHEKETLENVVAARNQAEQARSSGGPSEAGAAESFLTGRIASIFALAEAYPELRANEGFRDLQRSLAELETAIEGARRYYNAVVRDLNTRIQSFPDLLLASRLGFAPRDFFELDDQAEAAVPQVRF